MFTPKVGVPAAYRAGNHVSPVLPTRKVKVGPKLLFIFRAARVSRSMVKYYKIVGQMCPTCDMQARLVYIILII